jgi:tRNA dimethylallyltransferase
MAQVLCIAGPTASGKTALGIELASALGGEVVSADSMQIYRRMDIGTAKPTPEEMRGIPHHMIDILEPTENYSAARYAEDAGKCIDDILSRGKLPILVGGTGLYIDAAVRGHEFAEQPGDSGLREELEEQYKFLGGNEMLSRLRRVDPERAEKLHPSDKKRILRAIEVYILTGETITSHDEKTKAVPPKYDCAKIILSFENRQALYDRIDTRVDLMMERGLENEVRALLREGVPASATSMQAIGYKELAAALESGGSIEDAASEIKQSSRRYAKRQLTWFRRDKDALWLEWQDDTPDISFARQHSTEFLRAHGIEW